MNELHDLASRSLGRPSSEMVAERPGTASADAMELDPLSDVLRTVRLTGALFFLWHVAWPYATPVPAGREFAHIVLPGAQQIVSYHIVTEGTCWGALLGEPPLRMEAGDILLVPHGDAYVIASSRDACIANRDAFEAALDFFRRKARGELPFVVEEGRGTPSTHLICGFLGCDERPFNPALAALPRLVHLRATSDPQQARLQSLIDYTMSEAREPRPGGHCVLERLSELMFVEVVRRWALDAERSDDADTRAGWLAGLRHPLVGRVLLQLHRQPALPWTLESLADAMGVSRSRLVESFTRLVGQPPMQYLTQWRLQLAARLLDNKSAKVASIAREVGYESEAAFSRAFKRFVGVSPAQWRANAGDVKRPSGDV